MDPTEDLSARVLLKHILSTETPRTPITRSASKPQSSSATRTSNRLSRNDAGAQTPQDILRRSLRHKIRESITRQSLPATKRRTTSVVLRKLPSSTSMLFDDGDTPRHILKNIMLTEPVKSPVVHEKAASEEPQPSSSASSITRKRPSLELSGLDLRFNVTLFENRLKDGKDVEENEESIRDHSSLSLSSSTSLSLKTPFVDVRTEKKGLQRRVSNRRKISEEEFGAAVNKRQMAGVSSFVQLERGLSETEDFTLGQSKLSEPDITADILQCDTALYARPDAMTSSFSFVASQDKPTVLASQFQKQMEQEEQMEAEQSKLGTEKSTYSFPTEEGAEPQNEKCFSQSEKDADAAEFQKEKEKSTADGRLEDAAAMSEEEECIAESQTSVSNDTAESEEEENGVEAEKGAADSHTEEDAATRSQSEEEEPATDSQTEEGGADDSQTEEEQCGVDSQPEEDVTARSQSEEEDCAPDSQTEEEGGAGDSQTEKEIAVDLQCEEDVAARSQSEEEEDVAARSQSEEEEDVAARSQSEEEEDVAAKSEEEDDVAARSQSEEEGDVAEHQSEGKKDFCAWTSEQQEQDLEHIGQRARRSEGRLIMPVKEAGEDLADTTEAGWSDGKSKAHSSLEMESRESGQLRVGIPDLAESSTQRLKDACSTEGEPDADEENSFNLPERTHDIEESRHRSDHSPEEAAQQEEEWEDEEDEEESDEISSKTPAFVRQKMNFFQPDAQASPSVFKNIQASSSTGEAFSAPKPKQVRQRRKGPAKKEASLPKSYLMGVFKHFAKTNVSADVYPVLQDIMDKYFDRLAVDLETYAVHAKRKTIEVEDAELLLKRQGHVNDKVPVEVLIEKYLRMDQRKLLIPIATSGNVVIPKTRR
ncbi:eukaryotic translation initiation factor 5B [Perca fluviatilis]|uniref:eukaryotic translation initiation factor 5B n=1 Tax=Perca fluviatilis TaxID=8168 RepID=UPI0019649E9A|nr:eukaryotic translation initiation factor 5B [Perca fluviatilis]